MMRLEVIMPKEFLLDPARMKRIVENAMDQAAAAVQVDFGVTTSTWKHRPRFLVIGKIGERTIYTTDLIYKYVSEGTPPHIIKPRRAKSLHFFRTGFRPKSRIRYIGANQGAAATQDETFTKLVRHPGTQAREFAEEIQEKWQDELPKLMQDAIDAEVR